MPTREELLAQAKQIQRQKLLGQAKAIQKEKLMQANEPEEASHVFGAAENIGEKGVGMAGKVLNALKIPQALNYVGGVSRTGLGAAALPNVHAQDVLNALKGSPLSTSEMMEKSGIGSGKSLSDVIPQMYNKTGAGIRLQAGGWADPSARGAAGFVGDVATDPLTYLSGGVVPAVKAGSKWLQAASKSLPVVGKPLNLAGKVGESVGPALLNPATEGLQPLGKTMYKAGFKPLDAVSEKFGKEPVSDIAWRYNMGGTNKKIASQANDVLDKLRGQKNQILEDVSNSGVKPNLESAFGPAEKHASQLEASRNADRLDAAGALRQEINRYKEPLYPNVDIQNPVSTPGIKDLESVKQSMYGGLPQTAYKSGTRSAQDLGNVAQKQMARGVKEEIENTVGAYDPNLKPQFQNINSDMGGLLTTGAALDKEALKGTNKNLITSVDPIVYGLYRSPEGHGDVWTLALKKLADLSKTTAGRTTAGRSLYNFGNIPGMDEFLRRPNPWQGLTTDQINQGEE